MVIVYYINIILLFLYDYDGTIKSVFLSVRISLSSRTRSATVAAINRTGARFANDLIHSVGDCTGRDILTRYSARGIYNRYKVYYITPVIGLGGIRIILL